MMMETVTVLAHDTYGGDYRRLAVSAPGISPQVRPGQFVHVRLPAPADAILRRPFSVFKAEGGRIEVLYKSVGRGTAAMTRLEPGDTLDVLGPLGNGFPDLSAPDAYPVLVAGGYGMAALYLLARSLPRRGTAFFGGRSAPDILCVREFEMLGWNVVVATQDGTLGAKGLVTDTLDAWRAGPGAARKAEYFVCGPNGMLRAVGDRAQRSNANAWLSVDRNMACGVGACLTCVQKIRAPDAPQGWVWERVCREGPVFECREVIWEEQD